MLCVDSAQDCSQNARNCAMLFVSVDNSRIRPGRYTPCLCSPHGVSTQPCSSAKIRPGLSRIVYRSQWMRKLTILMLAMLALTACQGAPPTVVVVVSSTPDPNVLQITVTPSNPVAAVVSPIPATQSVALSSSVTQAATQSPAATQTPAPPTVTPGPTLTPTFFPTQTRAQLNIGQEDFQHGFTFWIQAKKVIWVLYTSPNNPNAGTWESYPDTFVDGEQESDPSLVPPSGLFQPIRGFGKVWRMPGIRDKLGWATTPEYALTTTYIYQPVGYLDANHKYVSQPGTHYITSLYHDVFALSQSAEGDKGTWVRNPSS